MAAAIEKTVLDNGTRILTHKMPHTRSVSMGVWVNVGARDETPDQSGLSHFIEHMIFKGTRKRNAFQIAKEFDAIGGHTNAFTTMENTCYHAKVMDTHTETMVDILSDIFLNSIFSPQEIERERPVILQEIGMVEDSPDEYVHVLAGRNFWGNHALGRSILGKPENIVQFDSEAMKSFFSQLYQPDHIVVSVAGNIDHSHLLDLVGSAFNSIRPGNGLPDRITPEARSLVDLKYRKLEQVHICLATMGLAISDPRRYAFSLLSTILGGNMSSRLFQEIREKRGLAYAVYSFIASHVDTGMFGVYLGVDPSHARKTTLLILDEIERLANEAVDESELRGAIEYTKGSLMLASESTDNQMVRTAQNEIHFGRHVPLKEVMDKVESVTPDEILDLARQLFGRNQMGLTMLGPVRDQKVFEEILYQ